MTARNGVVLLVGALAGALLAGCVGNESLDDALPDDDQTTHDDAPSPLESSPCLTGTGGPAPPPGEEAIGLQSIDLIFGGSLRHPLTRVALVPPTHGDLGEPTNMSRSALEYLQATLEGMFAWEPAIDQFIADYPQFSYLDNISVQIELFEGQVPQTAGYDILIGYVASGPAFRGVAIDPGVNTQKPLDDAGLGDVVHYGNRYILLSLFAYSERAGQTQSDFPETHELRGVTMHEFAHTWGLGHSTTFTTGCGADLMNSPYPYKYGDDNPIGDGGERTVSLCITSLDLYGLAHLYRWLPNATWEGSSGNTSLPADMEYTWYCQDEQASARADAWMTDHVSDELRQRLART